ncbi:MAG: T9SS type A sorting domain-containing protein [Bacteroidales bacterium]
MKRTFNLFLFIGSLFVSDVLFSQNEFVVFNDIIEYTDTRQETVDNGFYFLPAPVGSPSDWSNFWNGQFYYRYEVVSQPSASGIKLQYVIWQDFPAVPYNESCADQVDAGGTGSIGIENSSPSTWWCEGYGCVDFSRPSDFSDFAVVLWSSDHGLRIMQDNADVWAVRDQFLPLQVKVTIVAVAAGHEFSGWDNYLGGTGRHPTPDYGINFLTKQTDEAVPSADEYSYNSDMSGAVSGTGSLLSLTPGTDVYFRTKASGELQASLIQHLDVPSKPAAPNFHLDVANQRTAETVSGEYEYSSNADMSGAVSGTGAYVSIPAGTTRYFRKKAASSAFESEIQTLNETSQPPVSDPEFVIINEIIDYPNTTDNNGFYFFYHNADMPANWLSPYNFYNGTIYERYEIISQVTNEPIGFQFGIWQKLPPETGTLYESMSDVKGLYGVGDYSVSSSSPNTWWTYNGGVDYTQIDKIWHFGINPYKLNPDGGQIRSENADIWAERFEKWWPMQVRVTVVAVASGHTFSGWDSYVSLDPMPTPNYGIDYLNTRTDKVVPSTDEYSVNSNMSEAVNGSGAKITLTPGQDLYFRTKSQDGRPASAIQHLDVPSRPAAPSYTISYPDEATNSSVFSTVEYSENSNMSGATSGSGSPVDLTPGTDVYFRLKATGSAFPSTIFSLNVPSRPAAPAYSVDYLNETTNENIPSTHEYSVNVDMSAASSGNGSKLDLIPGTDVYLRAKATASVFNSQIKALTVSNRPSTPNFTVNLSNFRTNEVVPATVEHSSNQADWTAGAGATIQLTAGSTKYFRKPATAGSFRSATQTLIVPTLGVPVYSIDFMNELTNENVITEDEYSTNQTTWTSGAGSKVSLTPGTTIYFRKKADHSKLQTLNVPARPATPSFAIDYSNVRTSAAVSSAYEYSNSSNMSGAVAGTGTNVALTPGSNKYFRRKATSGDFASAVQTLVVGSRPVAPVYTIDYTAEKTVETVPATVEYSTNSNMGSAVAGTGTKVTLTPGTNLFFRVKSTAGSFASLASTLTVSARPSLPTVTIDYVNEKTNQNIASSTEYSAASNMGSAVSGTGLKLNVTPGTDLYFRTKATASAFASSVLTLNVPDRPAAPAFTIDFASEKTTQSVGNDIQYSTKSDFSSLNTGSGSQINLTPGSDLYFRKPATSGSFISPVQSLIVPSRPVIISAEKDSTINYPFEVSIILSEAATGFSSEDILVSNGTALNLQPAWKADIFPAAKGMTDVQIAVNAIDGGNFASNTFSVKFTGIVSSIENLTSDDKLLVYPNPTTGNVFLRLPEYTENIAIRVFDVTGQLVMDIENMPNGELDLSGLPKGIYVLMFRSANFNRFEKVILQ